MKELQSLSVLVFGAGAVGTYVGGSLALDGQRVVFLEQPAIAADLGSRGLSLDLSIDRRRRATAPLLVPPAAIGSAGSLEQALEQGPFDLALFAMKSFDTLAVLEQVRPFADLMPPVLCLQNGVDNEPALASLLGSGQVIAGTRAKHLLRPAGKSCKY